MSRLPRLAPEVVLVASVAAWALLSPLAANDLVGGDEGYYATMARNLLADPRQWASVSLAPLGPPGDKPPLVPALLAVAVLAGGFGEAALRSVPLVAALLALLAAVALARRAAGRPAAWAAAGVAATLPWLADGARVVAAEQVLTACGMWAVVLATRERLTPRAAAGAGALLGLAFLAKLWLAALPGLAVALALADRPRRLAAAAAGFMAVAPLHLLLVALVAPGQWAHWQSVVFGFSLGERAAGGGFAAYWLKGPAFYALTLAQALLLVLPLVAVGLHAAWTRREEPVARAVLAVLPGLALLSSFAVKSGGYAWPLVPLLVAAAGWGAAGFARAPAAAGWAALALAMLASPPLAARLGGPTPPFAAWALAWSAAAGAWLLRGRWPRAGWALLAVGCAVGAVRIAQRLPQRYHDPGYRAVAAWLAPRFAAAAPGDTVLIAPEAPSFQALLFRATDYWDTPYRPWTAARAEALARGGGPHVFVVDAGTGLYGGTPDAATLAWLERETREVTAEIAARAGRGLGVRVFVRE
jgi:4-amino-4-deoxy-L-arabinose transferase-like glycosyltransferase